MLANNLNSSSVLRVNKSCCYFFKTNLCESVASRFCLKYKNPKLLTRIELLMRETNTFRNDWRPEIINHISYSLTLVDLFELWKLHGALNFRLVSSDKMFLTIFWFIISPLHESYENTFSLIHFTMWNSLCIYENQSIIFPKSLIFNLIVFNKQN